MKKYFFNNTVSYNHMKTNNHKSKSSFSLLNIIVIIIVIYIIYKLIKYFKLKQERNRYPDNDNNYLEMQGSIITNNIEKYNIVKTYNNRDIYDVSNTVTPIQYLNNTQNNTHNNTQNIQYTNNTLNNNTFDIIHNQIEYHPLVKKIAKIIIGRYKIGHINKSENTTNENDKLYNQYLIRTVHDNVNDYINFKYTTVKEMNHALDDMIMLNDLIEVITLILSRILFNIVKDPLTRVLIAQYIIKKTNSNKEIENMYKYITSVADDPNNSVDTRMNAVDILNLSNNGKYMRLSERLINNVRNTTIQTETNNNTTNFNSHLNRVVQNSQRKQNRNNDNRNTVVTNPPTIIQQEQRTNVHQRPQMLVDRDGTTFAIPPDIDVAPFPTNLNDIPIIPPIVHNDNNGNNNENRINIRVAERSIYDDSQNVHNSTINITTLDTASELVKKYNPHNRTLYFSHHRSKAFDEFSIKKAEKVENAIHRINTDTSTFGRDLTLYNVYQSLLNLIEQHPQKSDMNERLLDELIDMSGKCSTGHLSRLINVLHGFETDLKVKVKININDEIYAKIKHMIEKSIMDQENMDDIMEDMLSDNKTIYLKFVKDTIKDNFDEILKEYENLTISDISGYDNENKYNDIRDIVTDIIIKSLGKYTGTIDQFQYLMK